MTAAPDYTVIIPARFGASRLPGKPLADLAGKPIVQWVHERALASGAARVVIATDDARIETAARAFGAEVVMTSPEHRSGTDASPRPRASSGCRTRRWWSTCRAMNPCCRRR